MNNEWFECKVKYEKTMENGLQKKVNEPLTGRKRELKLFPLSFREMVSHTSFLEERRMIPHRLIYGYYPEVVCSPSNEKVVLKELTDSYLYKDLLSFDTLRKPDVIVRLLRLLPIWPDAVPIFNSAVIRI